MKGTSWRSVGFMAFRCGNDCRRTSKGVWPLIWLTGKTGGSERFRAVLSAQPERVRKELRAAMLATDFRRKRSNNDWDFSFAAEHRSTATCVLDGLIQYGPEGKWQCGATQHDVIADKCTNEAMGQIALHSCAKRALASKGTRGGTLFTRSQIVSAGPNCTLAAQGFRTHFPTIQKTIRHARQLRTVRAPLFPRYIFLILDLGRDRWLSVRSTVGVSSLYTCEDRPVPVPEGIVETLIAEHGRSQSDALQ